ncbi:insulinase family protein [Microcoleus sp. FACHB-1515]|uniref:M16 family metallopeptidase n=1 Tax=Cyanophyceae TaxID=3028117 RepID=UPI00168993DD|nr:pitrilysin family protein [Microcoleus sp. FACHB-1515]MBD2088427.1 insulinase family protein [Microcoleus sp. FACHB-1515]
MFLFKIGLSRLLALFISIVLVTILITPGQATIASPPPAAPSISFTEGVRETRLDNGLTVLTKEVHTAPVVTVQMWYRVGSRNEAPGVNGISHQLEHLMFKGTSDRPIQFGRLFSALGSQSNAFTSYDETAYFGTVERDKLEALLTLEADRMENSVIDENQLTSEKRVVVSEVQGYENSPSYRLNRTVMRAAFPDRPYGLPVGGTRADVERFTVDQVRNYYQAYYTPNNAVLIVVGDFETEATIDRIRQLYGSIPQRTGTASNPQHSAATDVPVVQPGEPIVLRQPGSAALLNAVYPLPDIQHPDVPAIDLMDMILTGGRSSRLYQALVETGLASSIGAYPSEMMEPGWYSISATAAPGKEIAAVDRTLQAALTQFHDGVTQEELDRAKVQLKSYLVLSNQDISSQAMQLGFHQIAAGDFRYSDRYLQAVDRVTVADIQRVAQTYLDPNKRTVGYFEPTLENGQPGTSGAGSDRVVENFSPGAPVDPAEVARYLPPATEAADTTPQPLPEQFALENGLKVLLLRDRSTPAINLSGWVEAGSGFDTDAKAGVANLTATNLLNGTRTRNALELAQVLEDEGANLSFSANREGVGISGRALSANLGTIVQTLADTLQNATFPADQLELSRQRALVGLQAELDDPRRLGRRVFQQALYPENHPFHSFPTQESLTGITQADLASFYQQHYRPDTTTLAIVGDFDPAEVKNQLRQAFGNWQSAGTRPTLTFPNVALPDRTIELSQVIPGKAEAVTYLGYGGISRQDPRYYAALVLNQIVGGDTLSSRLGTEVRDRQGLTYGIYSYFQAGRNPGPFLISMQTAPDDAQKAIDSTVALLQQLRSQGITEAELEAAKRSIASGYPVDLASPDSLASVILSNEISELNIEELRQFPDRIEAVTMPQIQQAISDLIHPDNLLIVTAGPGAAS